MCTASSIEQQQRNCDFKVWTEGRIVLESEISVIHDIYLNELKVIAITHMWVEIMGYPRRLKEKDFLENGSRGSKKIFMKEKTGLRDYKHDFPISLIDLKKSTLKHFLSNITVCADVHTNPRNTDNFTNKI
uniref:Uncharacterized protein n=1 Tax=Glossina austeni TaxID=7395 RepID=A0A1A9V5L2_GLOAU